MYAKQLMIPSTPQQNGVTERWNRTLLDMVRSMRDIQTFQLIFRDALLMTTYILNRVPSKSVFATPYKLWHGKKPSLDHLRP